MVRPHVWSASIWSDSLFLFYQHGQPGTLLVHLPHPMLRLCPLNGSRRSTTQSLAKLSLTFPFQTTRQTAAAQLILRVSSSSFSLYIIHETVQVTIPTAPKSALQHINGTTLLQLFRDKATCLHEKQQNRWRYMGRARWSRWY
jgi:hypothetical protein